MTSGVGDGTITVVANPNVGTALLAHLSFADQSVGVMQAGSLSALTFSDVAPSDQYFDYISLMSSSGITAGCASNTPQYCPALDVARGQMATFIISAIDHVNHNGGDLPPNYTLAPYFTDDTEANDTLYPFVQRLADLRITNGCTATLFCPNDSVTQGQMAKLIIIGWMVANNVTTFTYTQTPYFTDVSTTDIFFSYIQKMRDLGFWNGCGPTTYCENANVTREQMASMIMRALLGAP